MLDVALRGGDVVDGTGGPRRRVDIGIQGGRIVSIGEVGPAVEEIDATGLIVAPGFCDVHTHFDAQVFWDDALTPSPQHGVTTVLAGNCGFTLTPMAPAAADYLVRMLAVVEGMPLAALRAGVPLDWTTTASYLDRIEGSLAINAGFLVGHSAMRRVVMGRDATTRPATPDEVVAMSTLLRDGLEAGGLGFSSSYGVAHQDGDGDPVPSRAATADELVTLAAVCARVEGTSLEFLPARVDVFDDAQLDLLTRMSAAAGRPLNWNVIRITEASIDETRGVLSAGAYAKKHSARIVALSMPIPSRARFSFATGFVLDALPGWRSTMSLPIPERVAALRDPAVRARLAEGALSAVGGLKEIAEFEARVIVEAFSPEAKAYEGHLIADIAREEGRDPFDVLLDIVCADDLQTTFTRVPSFPTAEDWRLAAELWREGHAMIGASDAGAHLDFTAYFDYPVYVLEHGVRHHGVLSLEEAVHLMTDVPAQLYGVRDRGRLTEGSWADIVLFDEATIATGRMHTRFDLPAGAGRLYAEPIGIHRVLVNGATVVRDGELTEARPGQLLRSGRDTRTPDLAI